jgi:hypothetical protein
LFPTLTVRESPVATAANRLGRRDPWSLDRVYGLFPRLRERAGQMARTLSGGEQQMRAIGRALMTNPKLLILDEATDAGCVAAPRPDTPVYQGYAPAALAPQYGPRLQADMGEVFRQWTGRPRTCRSMPPGCIPSCRLAGC